MSRYENWTEVFTGKETCSVGLEDVPDAVDALRQAFSSGVTQPLEWRLEQLRSLLHLLREGRDELCAALMEDLHKSRPEAMMAELSLCEEECLEAMTELHRWVRPKRTATSGLNWPAKSYTVRQPLGVVLVLGAWNYPVNLTLAPLVGAIAGGNCALIKPGSYALATSHAIARLVHKYMDTNCIKVAEGDPSVTTAILEEKFDMVFYTGSSYVGKIVAMAAAKNLTPCILELGGKSPTIVDKSAHLKHAADRIAWATFMNAGQTCVRPDFCLVHEDIADEFLQRLGDSVHVFFSSDPKSSVNFGRVINSKAMERLTTLIQAGRQYIFLGGKTVAEDRYVEPTIFNFGDDITAFRKHPLMQDELFGPLFPVVRYRRLEDALTLIGTLPGKPLACYCYARDEEVIDAVEKRTLSGGMCINDSNMHLLNSELPFGGVGESGMGSYHGERSFHAFTHEKAVLRKYPAIDELPILSTLLAARFPPYTPFKARVVSLFGSSFVKKLVNIFDLPAWLWLCLERLLSRATSGKSLRINDCSASKAASGGA